MLKMVLRDGLSSLTNATIKAFEGLWIGFYALSRVKSREEKDYVERSWKKKVGGRHHEDTDYDHG